MASGGEEKATTPEKEPGRQFNSNLPFRVWAQVDEDGQPDCIGMTPSPQPLAIPSCHRWWVEPLGRRDMAMVARELNAQRIPGLCLFPLASDGDLEHLKDVKGLQSLDLAGTHVTDAGLAHLKELQGLESLEFCWCSRVTGAGLAHLKELRGLRRLKLPLTPVTDASLVYLKELRGLHCLKLSETRVTDAGLAHLKELGGLRELDLWGTQVTDAGMAGLKDLTGLERLNLGKTRVTDAGLADLRELKGLRNLYLGDTKVTDAGIAGLRKSLPNLLGNAGAEARASKSHQELPGGRREAELRDERREARTTDEGRGRLGRHGYFTAPIVMPLVMWAWKMRKTRRMGRAARKRPAER
ncbi:MAG: hypothetical protein FJ290_13185 [Planctomycetes bacterium]|nr:hypothetical protein [Planctomycetota bacterium]